MSNTSLVFTLILTAAGLVVWTIDRVGRGVTDAIMHW